MILNGCFRVTHAWLKNMVFAGHGSHEGAVCLRVTRAWLDGTGYLPGMGLTWVGWASRWSSLVLTRQAVWLYLLLFVVFPRFSPSLLVYCLFSTAPSVARLASPDECRLLFGVFSRFSPSSLTLLYVFDIAPSIARLAPPDDRGLLVAAAFSEGTSLYANRLSRQAVLARPHSMTVGLVGTRASQIRKSFGVALVQLYASACGWCLVCSGWSVPCLCGEVSPGIPVQFATKACLCPQYPG